MSIDIVYMPHLNDRPWLLRRVGGTYEQHAHLRTKKMALLVRDLIDAGKYPRSLECKTAMQRIMTEEEFKKLNKKQRYYNVNKGIKR